MKNYWKLGMIGKRLHGFAVYLFSAILALFMPVGIDRVLYRVLKKQFEEEENE